MNIDYNLETLLLIAGLALLGALLGAALGYWRRGRDYVVIGAVIGSIALPAGIAALAVYVGFMGVLLLLTIILGILAG